MNSKITIWLNVADKVKTYFLAPPPFGINRYISHSLAFKSEETAKN